MTVESEKKKVSRRLLPARSLAGTQHEHRSFFWLSQFYTHEIGE